MSRKLLPQELTGKALFEHIVKNEAFILHAKKNEVKRADGITGSTLLFDQKGQACKIMGIGEAPAIPETADRLKLEVVINTTNFYDSHMDVHIPGLWNKSLSDNKGSGFYLLNSHEYEFEEVIGEGLTGSAKKVSWRDLGYQYQGITEALMFKGDIMKDRNPMMFEQYRKGYVKQHSVGMRYVKIATCINDEDYQVQNENWNKYFPMVVNPDECEKDGFFWAVLEAKIVEGSAVLFGSNSLTPTYSVEDASTKNQPVNTTDDKPQQFDLSAAIKQTNFIII